MTAAKAYVRLPHRRGGHFDSDLGIGRCTESTADALRDPPSVRRVAAWTHPEHPHMTS